MTICRITRSGRLIHQFLQFVLHRLRRIVAERVLHSLGPVCFLTAPGKIKEIAPLILELCQLLHSRILLLLRFPAQLLLIRNLVRMPGIHPRQLFKNPIISLPYFPE